MQQHQTLNIINTQFKQIEINTTIKTNNNTFFKNTNNIKQYNKSWSNYIKNNYFC